MSKTPLRYLELKKRSDGEAVLSKHLTALPTPVRYVGKPVYVLVGPKTYSAGEEFAYDLQVLKRAIVVGEQTRGGANPGGLNDLGSDLFVVVPTGRAENPITRGNWGGVGVRPDVQTSEATQETAVALAMRQLDTPLADRQ